jgi:hypothetical protein
MSSATFLMVLCKVFKLSFGTSSVTIMHVHRNTNDTAFQETKTPEIPAVFQGLACSMVLRTSRTNASICSVFVTNSIWSHYIVFGFGHFFDFSTYNIFTVSSQNDSASLYSSLKL